MPSNNELKKLLQVAEAFADADARYAKMREKRARNTKKENTPKVEHVIKKKRATRRKTSAVTHETYAEIFIRFAELLDESEIQRLFG